MVFKGNAPGMEWKKHQNVICQARLGQDTTLAAQYQNVAFIFWVWVLPVGWDWWYWQLARHDHKMDALKKRNYGSCHLTKGPKVHRHQHEMRRLFCLTGKMGAGKTLKPVQSKIKPTTGRYLIRQISWGPCHCLFVYIITPHMSTKDLIYHMAKLCNLWQWQKDQKFNTWRDLNLMRRQPLFNITD